MGRLSSRRRYDRAASRAQCRAFFARESSWTEVCLVLLVLADTHLSYSRLLKSSLEAEVDLVIPGALSDGSTLIELLQREGE